LLRALGIVTCLLLLLGYALADDERPAPAPKPLTSEQAADAVLAAAKAKDGATLQALAGRDDPDPWFVVDVLCTRGEHDVAVTLAKAASRPDTEKLPAYVEARRRHEPDKAEHELVRTMIAAMSSRRPQQVVDGTAVLAPALDPFFRIRLLHLRGAALLALGRRDESRGALRQAVDAALALGWLQRAQLLTHMMGESARQGADFARALASFEEGLALAKRRGHKPEMAGRLINIGIVYSSQGDYAKALSNLEGGLALAEEVSHRQFTLIALESMANAYRAIGNNALARSTYERFQRLRARKDAPAGREERITAARALASRGDGFLTGGGYASALSCYERALEQMKVLGDEAGATRALGGVGWVHLRLGDFAKALATLEQAREQAEAQGNKTMVAQALGGIGAARSGLGDYARALSAFEKALATNEVLGNKLGVAATLGNLANLYEILGDYPKALSTQEMALRQKEALGDKAGAAQTLGNMGNVYFRLGEYEKALSVYEQALARKLALGERASAPLTLESIGTAHMRLGHLAKALSIFEQALTQQEALGDKAGAAATLGDIGNAHRALGDFAKARSFLERSERAAKSIRATAQRVKALKGLARMHLDAGKPSRALAAAQSALRELEGLLGGLGEEQAATAREQYARLFGIGALAAVGDEDVAAALEFLESGRAGALLDTLNKREALRWKAESLSPELLRLDLEARARESAARRAYDLVVKQGAGLKERRSASNALDQATEAVRVVAEKVQRELSGRLRRQVGFFYPRAKTIEEIEATLEADQALVLYGYFLDEWDGLDDALALVLRHDGARVLSLGKASDVAAACESLDAASAGTDPSATLDALRRLLVRPLKLGKGVKQVLVSPDGPLCYLPFGALFERTVAMTPSGTTHGLLREEEREPGEGILAVGEPDYGGVSPGAQAIYYRGRTLSPLPATRKEVETIGTKTLLGAKASEAGLREALASAKRWRAVHFACHGLVDVERPMLSSLVLSHAGGDDGFLTALAILRTRIPADLAVLSACETGKGRIVKAEGIVGLTRAFMFAGTPRVICSLWKVDDTATQALMIKFYELWNPKEGKGLGAAEALRHAQDFIRGHDKWKHPYYWAAWVLWGLP